MKNFLYRILLILSTVIFAILLIVDLVVYPTFWLFTGKGFSIAVKWDHNFDILR